MRANIDRPTLLWRGFALGGLTTLGVLSVNEDAWEWWKANVTDSLPREAIQGLFWGSIGLHIGEAALARRRARKAGLESRGAWARTAFLYGFPALRRQKRHIGSLPDGGGEAEVLAVIDIDELFDAA